MAEQNVEANPGGGNQPGAGSGNTETNSQSTSVGGNQTVASGNGGGQFSYAEDRSKWVDPSKGDYIPRQRLNESTSKYEARMAALEARLEQQQAGVKQAFGIDTPTKAEQEKAALREALEELYPHLKDDNRVSREDLAAMREAAEQAQASDIQRWEHHAIGMVGDAEAEIANNLGQEKLTPTQERRVKSAYQEEANAAFLTRKAAFESGERPTMKTIRGDKDFLARHERGDKSLITEFTKAFLEDWFVPARRSVASGVAQRNRPVPQGNRGRTTLTKPPEIDYKDPNAFKKALLEARASGE